jgi:hypothetical protein
MRLTPQRKIRKSMWHPKNWKNYPCDTPFQSRYRYMIVRHPKFTIFMLKNKYFSGTAKNDTFLQ